MIINLTELPIYVINLPDRIDRKAHIKNEFQTIGLKQPIFVDGIKDDIGHIGCAKSHLKIIELAQQNKQEKIIVFEDDISFTYHHSIIKDFKINNDTDCLYLGISSGHIQKKNSLLLIETKDIYNNLDDDDFFRICGMLSTHGLCYLNNNFMNIVKKVCEDGLYYNIPHDLLLASVQPKFNVYALKKPLVFQNKRLGGVQEGTRIVL